MPFSSVRDRALHEAREATLGLADLSVLLSPSAKLWDEVEMMTEASRGPEGERGPLRFDEPQLEAMG